MTCSACRPSVHRMGSQCFAPVPPEGHVDGDIELIEGASVVDGAIVIRPGARGRVVAVLTIAFGLLALSVFASTSAGFDDPVVAVIALVLGTFFTASGLLGLRPRVTLCDDTVEVRNPTARLVVPWDQVTAIRIRTVNGSTSGVGVDSHTPISSTLVVLEMADHREVRLEATRSPAPARSTDSRANRIAHLLEVRRRQALRRGK